MSEEEARALMVQAHIVMHYRDKKASDMVCITTVNSEGVTCDEPIRIEGEWNLEWWNKKTNEFWRPFRIPPC